MNEMQSTSNASTASGRSLGTSMSKKNQQRLSLEITWKSLDQERQHFLKLMALNEKLLRSRQDKRANRMAHLQSHLTAPQIAELESPRRGKRGPKRLTGTEGNSHKETHDESLRGIDSADGVDNVEGAPSTRTIHSTISNTGLGGRSRSFYGHDRRLSTRAIADDKCDGPREVVNTPKEKSVTFFKERNSQSAPKIRGKSLNDTPVRTHPPTKSLLKPAKSGMTRSAPNLDTAGMKPILAMSTVPSRMRTSSSSSSPSAFSCHEESKRETERLRARSVGSSDRGLTPSSMSPGSDSVFRDAMDAIKTERTRTDTRNLMVIENGLQLMHLQRRKDELMSDIDEMVKRDQDFAQRGHVFLPPTTKRKATLTSLTQAELINAASQGADINDLRKEIRRRKNDRMRERMKMDIPADQLKRKEHETEEDHARRIEKWWREMRKVRYLRRASTKQDLGDVVTLAMAQKNNDNIWRQSLRDNLF
eukprot:XP_011678572.1 PREDICTED: uncharacterized protein LOC105445129 [Strongylocentrotus purpuratus]